MSDAVGGRGIGCRIGRTSPRSCFTGQGVAQSFFVRKCRAHQLRALATAGGVQTRFGNRNWLPVAELRSSLMKVLEPSTEVGCKPKMCILAPSCFCGPNLNVGLSHGAMLWDDMLFCGGSVSDAVGGLRLFRLPNWKNFA